MKKTLFSTLYWCALSIPFSFAQNYMGVMQSDYAGVLQAEKNPAFLVDNRMKIDVNLLGISTTAYNDHLYMNTRNMPHWWIKSFDNTDPESNAWMNAPNFAKIVPADSTDYYQNTLQQGNFFTFNNPKAKHRKAFTNVNVDILNAMISLSEKRAIGIGIKHRTLVNVDNVADEIITLASEGLDYPSLWNIDLSDELLNISANSWMEYNLSYAQVLIDEGEHFLKGGGKVKFLQGLGSFFVYTDNVDYNFSNQDTALYIRGDFDYGYSSNLGAYIEPLDNNDPFGNTDIDFNNIYKLQSKLGLGFDIGAVYEWRPNHKDYRYDMDGETNRWRRDQNKYKLRLALAIDDIGGMKYDKGDMSRNFRLDASTLDLSIFDDVSGFRSFDTTILALRDSGQLSFNEDDGSYFMNLPTSINFNVDYHIIGDFYVNLDALIALPMNKDPHKVKYGSHVAVSARYDYKWAGISIPVSYGDFYGLRAGVGLRLGPIFLGTADIRPFIAPGKDRDIRGADFFMAMTVPIPHAKPKDRDGDLVSDKVEKKHRKEIRKETGNKKAEGCIDVPGTWEFKGCPDTDGDHIQDTKDSCIYDPGTAEFFGCPDTDGDKIIDKKDDCPLDSGLAVYNGCPDTDMDGIIDRLDSCVLDSGLVEFNGCPDRDGDGIKDLDDLCPDHAGPKDNQGCPDTDSDGLFDFVDDCPETAGPKDNHGCPWPDTDEDGILDKDDDCPNNPGLKDNNGCPHADTDKDGVLDKDDECPNTPGTKENKGCPELDEHDQDILNAAFDNLEFEVGRAIIRESSYPSLDSLASLLIKRGEWKLEIAGHTDNVGSASSNLALSKKRSQAVADYLHKKGIEKTRLEVQYFGEEKPIADNSTTEGRQKNRRVEMTVIFE